MYTPECLACLINCRVLRILIHAWLPVFAKRLPSISPHYKYICGRYAVDVRIPCCVATHRLILRNYEICHEVRFQRAPYPGQGEQRFRKGRKGKKMLTASVG